MRLMRLRKKFIIMAFYGTYWYIIGAIHCHSGNFKGAVMGKLVANVDDDVKARAAELYESMGMSLSTAVNMFLRQSLVEDGLPFRPRRYEGVRMTPTETTRRAMVEAEAKELGLIPDDSTVCDTEADVRAHLRSLRASAFK